MVDFESDATIGSNRADILAIVVIQRRYDFLNNYEKYVESSLSNKSNKLELFNKLKSGLLSLFYELKKTLERNSKKKGCEWNVNELLNNIFEATEIDNIMECYNKINTVLDDIGVIPIDNKKQVDYSRIIHINRKRSQ